MRPTAAQRRQRKLSSAHFAFVRALIQGVEPARAFAQYLQLEGEASDLRLVKKTIRWIRDEIAAGTLGGLMYLKPNVKSLAAVKAMNAAFRAASPDLPPFLTLDQEGGAVERLTKDVGFNELPNAQTIAADNTPAQAEAIYAKMAKGIADEGFTVNFGPIADLNINPDNPIIGKYGRSFSKDGKTVTAYDEAFITAHHDAGLLTALKHFPGHGSSTADSHEGFVDISKTWDPVELGPYRSLFANGYDDFVMVGHLYNKAYAGDGSVKLPASCEATIWSPGARAASWRLNALPLATNFTPSRTSTSFGAEAMVK